MKIKLYIVTYNHQEYLDKNLSSLFQSDMKSHDVEVFIINNHSNFFMKDEYLEKVTVLHNSLRPDWSTGHLTRNWNQAIINGFQDIDNPDCDIVVHAQDDLEWSPGWVNFLVFNHQIYDFINIGTGDAVCSYTPQAIKKIGLWDERFCAIGYHVADYHVRAVKYNSEKSSINDIGHGRVWNPLSGNFGRFEQHQGGNENVVLAPKHDDNRKNQHDTSSLFHPYNENIFKHKWGNKNFVGNWKFNNIREIPPLINRQYVTYPYFETSFTKNGHECYEIPCKSRIG